MAFVKLDTGILDSTLWIERNQREIFITSLLMAEPREFIESIPQIEIGSMEVTGFEAPPGWYGFVRAAGIGIINRAGVDREPGMAALQKLGEPEMDSRSKDFLGRRMIRVDGGFLILNYMKYRDKDHTAAQRQARLRERRKEESLRRDVTESHSDGTLPLRYITQADADADADAYQKPAPSAKKRHSKPSAAPVGPGVFELPLADKSVYEVPAELYSEYVTAFPGISVMGEFAKMRTWLISNRARMKTRQGMPKFMNSWLSREQDRNGGKTNGRANGKSILDDLQQLEDENRQNQNGSGTPAKHAGKTGEPDSGNDLGASAAALW